VLEWVLSVLVLLVLVVVLLVVLLFFGGGDGVGVVDVVVAVGDVGVVGSGVVVVDDDNPLRYVFKL